MGAATAMVLWGFPISMVILSVFMQGGILQGSPNTAVTFCNSPSCVPNGTSTVITCNAVGNNQISLTAGACRILPSCVSPPAPAWCFPWPLSIAFSGTFLSVGDTVVLTSTQFNSGLSAAGVAVFPFTSIGPLGWISVLIIGVGVAVLLGFTILGNGLSPEAVHILWISGLAVGIWVILSAFDGFLTGTPTSLFAYLNSIVLSGTAVPIGTALWMICTLLWVLGTVSLVSRGN